MAEANPSAWIQSAALEDVATLDIGFGGKDRWQEMRRRVAAGAVRPPSAATRYTPKTSSRLLGRDVGSHRRVLVSVKLLAGSDIYAGEKGSPNCKEHD